MLNQLKSFLDSQESDTVYLRLRIIPKAAKTEITEHLEDDSWKIRVKAVPEKGKANTEIIHFLEKELDVKEVEICGGKTDRIKLVRIVK